MRLRATLGIPAVAVALALLFTTSFAADMGSPGPNQLYGHITSDRTLTYASPGPNYEIIGDLTVDSAATLTIEAGVSISVAPYSDFLASGMNRGLVEISVFGTLMSAAVGAMSSLGTAYMPTGAWAGITVMSGGTAVLHNLLITGAGTGLTIVSGGNCTISHVNIDGCSTGALVSAGGTLVARASTVRNVVTGLDYARGAYGDVKGCFVQGRGYSPPFVSSGVGLSLPFSPSYGDSTAPEPNLVRGFAYGVLVEASGLTLRNMIIDSCTAAIHDDWPDMTLQYCTFVNNGYCAFGALPGTSAFNCIFVGLIGNALPFYTGPIPVDHVVSWGNQRFGNDPWASCAPGEFVSSFNPYFVPGDGAYHLSPASFFTNFSVSGGQVGAYGPGPVGPTPVMTASVISADAADGAAKIRWYVGAGGEKASIVRKLEGAEWEPNRVLLRDGSGYVTLEDRDVMPGTRYGYAIGTQNDGQIGIDGEVWVTVEQHFTELSRPSISPNPSPDGWTVSFTSPSVEPVKIEVLDVSGRLVHSQDMGQLAIGQNSTHVHADGLSNGVYWVRVRQGGRIVSVRAVKAR